MSGSLTGPVAVLACCALGGFALVWASASQRAAGEPVAGERIDSTPAQSDRGAQRPARARHVAPAATTTGARPTPPPRPAGHTLLRVRPGARVQLRRGPGGRVLATAGDRTRFGSPTVLGVVERRPGWLGVTTEHTANGRLAWVRDDPARIELARTGYSLHADLSERRLELRRDGRRLRTLRVAVGRPGASTPTGRFSVTDRLSGRRFGAYYGCCILAMSGTQPNLPQGWGGGDSLAIHGTDSPGSVGHAASAGCMRAHDRDLRALTRRVPLGTPVFVRS